MRILCEFDLKKKINDFLLLFFVCPSHKDIDEPTPKDLGGFTALHLAAQNDAWKVSNAKSPDSALRASFDFVGFSFHVS